MIPAELNARDRQILENLKRIISEEIQTDPTVPLTLKERVTEIAMTRLNEMANNREILSAKEITIDFNFTLDNGISAHLTWKLARNTTVGSNASGTL